MKMTRYSIERTAKKYIKGYRFLSFMRNLSNKFEKNDIGYCYKKTWLDAVTTASKNSP